MIGQIFQTIAVSPASLPTATANNSYFALFAGSGGSSLNPTYSYAATGSLAPGMKLMSTGLLWGTPTVPGSYQFTVTATFTGNPLPMADATGSTTYTLVINPAVVVNPATIPSATVASGYSQQFSASGGSGSGYSYSAAGNLDGLTLRATGLLSGQPVAVGSFAFSVTATDGNGGSATEEYSLVVGYPPIAVSPTTIPGATRGSVYSQQFSASGGSGSGYSYAAAGNLDGLTLSAAGLLSGTPTAAGSFAFTLTITDSNNDTANQAIVLIVNRPGTSTTITSPASVVAGQPASFLIAVSGGGPTPTGTVTLFDNGNIIDSGPLNASGQATIATSALTLGTHPNVTAVYSGDSNYLGSTSAAVIVQVGPPTFSDSFTRTGGSAPNLGPSWTLVTNVNPPAGSFTIVSNQAVAAGTGQNAAIVDDFTPSDVSVSAQVTLPNVAGAVFGGVIARRDNTNDAYAGLLFQMSNDAVMLAELQLIRGNVQTNLATPVTVSSTSGVLRLDAYGTALKLYFNGSLLLSASDATLTAPGGVGILDEGGGTEFSNFTVYQLLAGPTTFTDNFTRPNATTLGDPWSVDAGGFGIGTNQAIVDGTAALNVASLYGVHLSNVSVEATMPLTGEGSGGGVVAQWNSATQSGYMLILSSPGTLTLYKVTNSVATVLKSQTGLRFIGATSLTVELDATLTGDLTASVNGNPIFQVTDTTYMSGSVGLASNGGSTFTSFTASGS